MSTTQRADQVLERHYLEIRAELLNLAAAFDRMERSDGFQNVTEDPRLDRIRKGLAILTEPSVNRAEKLQLLFSDAYDPHWRT